MQVVVVVEEILAKRCATCQSGRENKSGAFEGQIAGFYRMLRLLT